MLKFASTTPGSGRPQPAKHRAVGLWLLLVGCLGLADAAAAGARSSGCAGEVIVKGSRQERSIDVDGVSRSFILDVPETIEAQKATPLLLDFHGFGHSAAGVWQVSGFRELGVRERFITVYPQGLDVHLLHRDGAGWDMVTAAGNRDVTFTRRLLDEIERQYCIDRERVFVTGFSNGAFLSHLLGCELSDRIAAIAPVGGGQVDLPCTPSRPVAAIIHHGRNDAIVSVERGRSLFEAWKKIDGCPGEQMAGGAMCARAVDCRAGTAVVYCEGDGEHRWPPEATVRIWEFFKSHPMEVP